LGMSGTGWRGLQRMLVGVLGAALGVAAWAQQAGGRLERLILKDGSYQVVRQYAVKDGRVRFRSAERDESNSGGNVGGWEEMPENLVDWAATERWNYVHAPGAKPEAGSAAAQTALELDREAAAERAAEAARQPEVAPGLRLPDSSGVWGLDLWHETPELVRIRQSDGDLNLDLGHSVKGMAIPRQDDHHGARDVIRLAGYKAVVSFHVPQPVFYIALDVKDEPAREDAMTVDTHGASSAVVDKSEQASPASTYVLVRLRVWKDERTATAEQLRAVSMGGDPDGSAEVVATTREILPGGRWMRVTPRGDLNLGQYSLVEVFGGRDFGGFNQDGWDFGVNPMAGENKGGFLPLTGDGR
jgi:hypothetical protein